MYISAVQENNEFANYLNKPTELPASCHQWRFLLLYRLTCSVLLYFWWEGKANSYTFTGDAGWHKDGEGDRGMTEEINKQNSIYSPAGSFINIFRALFLSISEGTSFLY